MKNSCTIAAVLLLFSSSALVAAPQVLSLDGRYAYRTDAQSQEHLGQQVCFFPSSQASARSVRAEADLRKFWFCFRDANRTARLLGFKLDVPVRMCGIQGRATVVVTGYHTYQGEGDGNDVATLHKVVRSSRPQLLPCD